MLYVSNDLDGSNNPIFTPGDAVNIIAPTLPNAALPHTLTATRRVTRPQIIDGFTDIFKPTPPALN